METRTDEQQIRELVATWLAATKQGDVKKLLSLITDDVVFLLPGQAPMVGRAAFANASGPASQQAAPRFDATSEIQEIQVLGDWAFMWTRMNVVITSGGSRHGRSGYTLSILKKVDGKWLLARDANMLVPVH